MAKKSKHPGTNKATTSAPPNIESASKPVHKVIGHTLFLGILALLVYANTLQNGYALDDTAAIRSNTLVKKGAVALPQIFCTTYWYGYENNKNDIEEYRPLSLAMFAIEQQLYPNNPTIGHLVNILLYSACCMVLFQLLYHLFKKKRPFLSFVATLLFALHPIHTEVVANIKSRDELLCFFFAFLALLTFVRYAETQKKGLLLGGLVLYFLSLISKESSITLVAVIPIILIWHSRQNRKISATVSLLCLIPVAIYLLIRHQVIASCHIPKVAWFLWDNPLIAAPTFAIGLATKILILGQYLRLLLIPYPLISDYSYNAIPFVGFNNLGVWCTIVIYGLAVALAVVCLYPRRQNQGEASLPAKMRWLSDPERSFPLAVGILFLLATIAIYSNFFLLIGAEMAERFMFFPSVGFCIVIAFVIEQSVVRSAAQDFKSVTNKKALYILVPVAAFFILLTVKRNSEWQDDLTLYTADSKKSPNDSRLYYFAGAQQLEEAKFGNSEPDVKRDLYRDGIINLQRCIAVSPDYGWAHFKLTGVFLNELRLDSAELHGQMAMKTCPQKDGPMNTLANVYMVQQKYADAIGLLWQACALSPQNAEYPGNLGFCYLYLKNYDSATWYFLKSTRLDPSYSVAREYLPFAFKAAGLADSAKKYETIARQSEPGFSLDRLSLPKCGYYH